MPTTHDLTDMRNGIDCGEERAIQPSPTLRYELWERFGNIGFADGSLDIFEHPEEQLGESDFECSKARTVPARVGFGYQFETKDTLESIKLGFRKIASRSHPQRDLSPH